MVNLYYKLLLAFKSGGIRSVYFRIRNFLGNRIVVCLFRIIPPTLWVIRRNRAIIRILAKQAGEPDSIEMLNHLVTLLNTDSQKADGIIIPAYFGTVFQLVSPLLCDGKTRIMTVGDAAVHLDVALFNKHMLNQVPASYSELLDEMNLVFENGTYVIFAKSKLPESESLASNKRAILDLIGENRQKGTESQIKFDGFDFIVRCSSMDEAIIREVKTEYIDQLKSEGFYGKHIIDIGAHIGSFSIQLTKMLPPDAKIVSIEPSPDNFLLLKRNVLLNNLRQNFVLKMLAISSNKGVGTLFISSDNTGGNKLDMIEPSSKETVEVAVDTLEAIADEFGDDTIDLLKIDVEGSEHAILLPNKHLLTARFKYIIGEAGGSVRGDGLTLVNFLRSIGFKVEYTGNEAQLIFIAKNSALTSGTL